MTILLFLAALAAPTADFFLRPEARKDVREEERNPAPFPSLDASLASLSSFPPGFESWLNDSMGLRDKLLTWNSRLKIGLFGVSPVQRVVFGKDGWLYLTVARSLDVHRGLMVYTHAELEAWRRSLESRRDFCERRGAEFVFAIAPNKTEIYPEQLSERFNKVGPTCLEQLIEYLRDHSSVRILDLRPALLEEKKNDEPGDFVYYPLGSHWTDRGIYAGYRTILDRLGGRFPSLVPAPLSTLHWKDDRNEGDSWAGRLRMQGRWHQESHVLAEIEADLDCLIVSEGEGQQHVVALNPGGVQLPRLVMFHDSFGDRMRKLLAMSFSRCAFSWESNLDANLVETERPDVVIQLYVERSLAIDHPVLVGSDGGEALEQEFEASKDVCLSIDVSADPPAIKSSGAARLTPTQDGLEVQAPTGVDMIVLPELVYPSAGIAVLRIELTATSAGVLDILYTTRSQPSYRRGHVYSLPFAPGRSRLHCELLDRTIAGSLMIRPGRDGAILVLHALEVRAVPRE